MEDTNSEISTVEEGTTLLLVDDDGPFVRRLGRAMESRGFTVDIAETVADGLAKASTTPPDYAVIDMRLGDGNGLDVVGGSVASNRVVFKLARNALDGAMQARMADKDTMNVTVSVKVENELVPVIGINLKRLDGGSVGAVAKQ